MLISFYESIMLNSLFVSIGEVQVCKILDHSIRVYLCLIPSIRKIYHSGLKLQEILVKRGFSVNPTPTHDRVSDNHEYLAVPSLVNNSQATTNVPHNVDCVMHPIFLTSIPLSVG